MQQRVSTHVDDVNSSPAIDKHVNYTSVAVHGGIVHGSEPMLVSAVENQH